MQKLFFPQHTLETHRNSVLLADVFQTEFEAEALKTFSTTRTWVMPRTGMEREEHHRNTRLPWENQIYFYFEKTGHWFWITTFL